MDKLAKVRAEIERLKEIAEYNLSHSKMDRGAWMQQASVCTNLLSFVDSMQEEPASEDLEKAINFYIENNFFGSETLGFFSNRTKEEPNDQDIALAFKAGAKWHKEQMMRRATDGQIEIGEDYLRIKCLCMSCPPQYDGKLVKFIIINED